MISILNMAMVQLFTKDVERLSWDSFGILVVVEVPYGRLIHKLYNITYIESRNNFYILNFRLARLLDASWYVKMI